MDECVVAPCRHAAILGSLRWQMGWSNRPNKRLIPVPPPRTKPTVRR